MTICRNGHNNLPWWHADLWYSKLHGMHHIYITGNSYTLRLASQIKCCIKQIMHIYAFYIRVIHHRRRSYEYFAYHAIDNIHLNIHSTKSSYDYIAYHRLDNILVNILSWVLVEYFSLDVLSLEIIAIETFTFWYKTVTARMKNK